MKRFEVFTIYFFLFSTALISITFVDLFPFSLNPLFTKSAHKISFISLSDQNKIKLKNSMLEVFVDYDSSFEKAGIKKFSSLNKVGSFISREKLELHLLNKLRVFNFIKELNVTIINIEGKKSGVTKSKQYFKLKNPHYSSEAPLILEVYGEDKYKRRIKNGDLNAP